MSTFGPAYEERQDGKRIGDQMERIKTFMLKGSLRTLSEIAGTLHYPEASVSAQLRHLRKDRFGAYVVEKRRRTAGTWEYRLLPPVLAGQTALF